MKIYTRTGDSGNTSLIGGRRVSKADLRVDAYGVLDEVNAFVGVAIQCLEENETLKNELRYIQQKLFDCGTDLANPDKKIDYRISKEDIRWLEEKIDEHTNQLPPLERFILPGGSRGASYLHLARTVVRRGEREMVRLSSAEEINQDALCWVNRLSDYLFVTARLVNVMLGIDDIVY